MDWSKEDWFILLAAILLFYFWYSSMHKVSIQIDQDNYSNALGTAKTSSPVLSSLSSFSPSPKPPSSSIPLASAPLNPSSAWVNSPQYNLSTKPNNVITTTTTTTTSSTSTSSGSPSLTQSSLPPSTFGPMSSSRTLPLPSASIANSSQWKSMANELQTYVQAHPVAHPNVPTAINPVPHVGPFGITTGNPLDDTPILFTENHVLGLYSMAAKKYLQFVPVEQALPGSKVTSEIDLVLQANAPDAAMDKSAQWIVRPGIDLEKFPHSIRLENVLYPGRFLKGYRYQKDKNSVGAYPEAGWQPGNGQTTQSDLYSTMVPHISPQSKDNNSVVLWSSLMASESKSRLSAKSPIFLASNQEGVIVDPNQITSITDISWRRHHIGRQTVDGKIVYAAAFLEELQRASEITGETALIKDIDGIGSGPSTQ